MPPCARHARELRALGACAALAAVVVMAACGDTPVDDSPIRLPDRVASADGGEAGSPDATAVEGGNDASPPDTCANGKKDGAETDVDCGGPKCTACANGKTCGVGRDCASLVCSGTTCSGDLGCSDGTREGFTALGSFRDIAACGGGWSLPGLLAATTLTPACARGAGNDSVNPTGAGCSVADLCQLGWHVCTSPADVAAKTGGAGCAGADIAGAFFVARQSGPGGGVCAAGGNDLFGCGGIGSATDPVTCTVLNRSSNDLCSSLTADWKCGTDGLQEANNVTKTSGSGGALCCRD